MTVLILIFCIFEENSWLNENESSGFTSRPGGCFFRILNLAQARDCRCRLSSLSVIDVAVLISYNVIRESVVILWKSGTALPRKSEILHSVDPRIIVISQARKLTHSIHAFSCQMSRERRRFPLSAAMSAVGLNAETDRIVGRTGMIWVEIPAVCT